MKHVMTPGHLLMSQIRQTQEQNKPKMQGKSGEVILPGLSQGRKISK